jgi:uncharacterized alpha-E superfamily protein
MSVLKSLSAYQMYRQHGRLRVQGADVLKFLLCNEEFPRSFYYCLEHSGYCLKGLPRHATPLRALKGLLRLVEKADLHALALSKDSLHAFIDELQRGLNELHESIHAVYFSVRHDDPVLIAIG